MDQTDNTKRINSSYFPLKIEYTDTREQVIVKSPENIQYGREFRVLKTKAKVNDVPRV